MTEYYTFDRSPGREFLDFRHLGLEPVRLMGRYRYAQAHEELPEHSHGEMMEICYLESGEQTYRVGDRTYRLTGGDLFVTRPREAHSTGGHPEARGVLYWLLLGVPGRRNRLLGLPDDESRALFARLLRLSRRQFRAPDAVKPTLHRIFQIGTSKRDAVQTIELRNLLMRFLLDVVAGSASSDATPVSPAINEVLRHLDEHLDQPVAMAELAERAGMSLSRFKARFKQEVGVPPSDYLLRQRVETAARLLFEGKKPVTEVAFQLGFSSSQYFATVFKRYTRHSPGEARNHRVHVA